MRVIVDDDGLDYVKKNGKFESVVHNVQLLSLPDTSEMSKPALFHKEPKVVPVRLVGIVLVNSPEGKLMFANMEKCTVVIEK